MKGLLLGSCLMVEGVEKRKWDRKLRKSNASSESLGTGRDRYGCVFDYAVRRVSSAPSFSLSRLDM